MFKRKPTFHAVKRVALSCFLGGFLLAVFFVFQLFLDAGLVQAKSLSGSEMQTWTNTEGLLRGIVFIVSIAVIIMANITFDGVLGHGWKQVGVSLFLGLLLPQVALALIATKFTLTTEGAHRLLSSSQTPAAIMEPFSREREK